MLQSVIIYKVQSIWLIDKLDWLDSQCNSVQTGPILIRLNSLYRIIRSQFKLNFMYIQAQSVPTIIKQFMQTAQQSLVQVITSLQSDQLLQQMRNDQNLYQQKMNYINQLIRQHFVLQPLNDLLIQEIESLKQAQTQLQNRLQESREEYISQLSNIEVQYNQFLLEKENQKRLMENTIEEKNHEIFILNKDFNIKTKDLQVNAQTTQKQLNDLKNTLNNTTRQLQQSKRENHQLSQQLTTLKQHQQLHSQQTKSSSLQLSQQYTQIKQQYTQIKHQYTQIQQQNTFLQNKLNQLQTTLKQLTQNQQAYIQTIEKMKDDMFLIKDEWEKRCDQLQTDLTQDYRNKLIANQQQMNSKLQLYLQELKMGKNVIIESSQEILQSKKQLIQERFNIETKRFQQDIAQLESQLQQQKSQSKHMLSQLKTLGQKLLIKQQELKQTKLKSQNQLKETKLKSQNQLKSQQSLMKLKHEQLQQRLSISKHQTDKQIDRLRKTQNMLLKDLKTSKLQKEQILKQVHSLKEQFTNYKQKQLKQAKRLKDLEHLNQTSHSKILQLKKDLAIMTQKSTLDQRTLKDKNNQLNRLENNLSQTKHQLKQLDTVARRLQLKVSQLNLKHKQHQRIKAQTTHKLQKIYLLVRKLSKQLTLVKQDVMFQLNIFKPQLQGVIISVGEQLQARDQANKLTYKHKVRDLLDQVEDERRQQRHEQDQLLRENQNMKKEIKLLQQIMQEKEQDHLYHKDRTVNIQVEKCRAIMQQELTQQREHKKKLSEKLYQQQKRFDYNITKSEKQLTKNISSFMTKWEHKLAQTQQLLLLKQKALKELSSQLKKLAHDHESTHQQLRQSQQKLQKQAQKYQSLKQQRDKTIDELMRRLQKQTRHKLTLQKQLKGIRGEIMKTQTNTNTSSPFNNYSFTDRENTNLYTNAFQTATQDKLKTHIKQTNREKELSEIREMIAKTYKVVETGPEKDQPLHKGRLF